MAFSQIPYATEQGIISAEQGILVQEQGIFPVKSEIITGWGFRYTHGSLRHSCSTSFPMRFWSARDALLKPGKYFIAFRNNGWRL